MEKGGVPLNGEKALIVSWDMLTPYGRGLDVCWKGLMTGKTAISRVKRFDTRVFQSDFGGTVQGLVYLQKESLVMQMLRTLFEEPMGAIPGDAKLLLATTKGEIDLLEQSVFEGKTNAGESNPASLLNKVQKLAGLRDRGMIISSACASSTAALARAASMVRTGESDCVLVVACDGVTEFVFSGFSTLMALDKVPARPFDSDRKGLNIGEAAAYALIMSGSRAHAEKREILGEISGWGLSSDANHMTGPSYNGAGQAIAIRGALKSAGYRTEQIGSISAHGTGTVYNDSMEMKAIRSVFKEEKRPVYSIKGGVGHTMGAAGLVESLLALRSLRDGMTPPTLNLRKIDPEARGWVFPEPIPFDRDSAVLSTNSGFGGVNAALVLSAPGAA